MKTVFSLLIALLLMTAAAGCGAPQASQDTPRSGGSVENSAGSGAVPDALGDLLAKTYTDLLQSGSYLLHYQGTVSADGMTVEMEAIYATDGKTVSTTMTSEGYTTHVLMQDDAYYVLNDAAKTYTVLEVPPELADPFSGEAMEYVGKGTATVDGKEMAYEEYDDGVGVMRFYFDDKTLYAIAQQSDQGETVLKVLELSDRVTLEMLSIPDTYTQADAPGGGYQALPEEVFSSLTPEERAEWEEAMAAFEQYEGGQQP